MQASSDHSSSRIGTHRVQSLSLLLLFTGAAGLVGCSKADSSQGEWPDPAVTQPDDSTQPGDSPSNEQGPDQESGSEPEAEPSGEDGKDQEPDATTPEPDEDSPGSSSSGDGSQDESAGSTTQDPSGGDTDKPGDESSSSSSDTTSTPTSSQSTTTDETQSSSSSSSSTAEDSSSQSTQDTGEESSDDGGDPAACELELCVRMNDTQPPANRSWRAGVNMFSFQVPKTHRRLARIELFEGLGTGQTRVSLRLDAGTSSAAVVEWLQWAIDLPSAQAWRGATLSEPFEMQAYDKLWVVIGENPPSRRASIASSGISYSIWHRASGSQSWTESSALLKFRAFCCKE